MNTILKAIAQERINLYKKDNVLEWAAKFKVTIEEIRTAVLAVGSIAINVDAYLKAQKPSVQ
jgi:uncharacterized protein DUF3606